jgi:hypothetical protein
VVFFFFFIFRLGGSVNTAFILGVKFDYLKHLYAQITQISQKILYVIIFL